MANHPILCQGSEFVKLPAASVTSAFDSWTYAVIKRLHGVLMSHLDPLTQPDPKLGVFPPVSVPAIHSGLLSSDNVNSDITLMSINACGIPITST